MFILQTKITEGIDEGNEHEVKGQQLRPGFYSGPYDS